MKTIPFSLPTRDGRTELNGLIEIPNGRPPYPAVVIVNGGWFMERDGFMGDSGTERDLVYRDLAQALVRSGVAVVRYDNRGVRGNEMTMPPPPEGADEAAIAKHYLKECVDAAVRLSVTVETQVDDVETVWRFTTTHPQIARERVAIWAHSEGALNAARLIGAGRIDPCAVINVGAAPLSSPARLFRWQMVDRYVEHLLAWDVDGDGRVSRADIARCYAGSLFPNVGIDEDRLVPPAGFWSRDSAHAFFMEVYLETRAGLLSRPDDHPYPEHAGDFPMVAASNAWARQWLEDEKAIIDHYAEYQGYLSFHLGGLDSQLPAGDDFARWEADARTRRLACEARLVFHPGRGHSMATGEPASGPMDEEARAQFVEEAATVLGLRNAGLSGNSRLVPLAAEHISLVSEWAESAEVMLFWAGHEDRERLTFELQGRCMAEDGIAAYVLLRHGEPCAYGETWWDESDGSFELARLIVAPSMRRKRLGSRLIKELMKAVPVRAESILVRVFTANTAARCCYQKAGFSELPEDRQRELNQGEVRPFVWMRWGN